MTASRNPLLPFLLKALLWLPVAFVAWYFGAILLTAPVAQATDAIMTALFPGIVQSVNQHGYTLEVITGISPRGSQALLATEINALMYGYSLPLFAAMVLAAPSTSGQKLRRLLLGGVVLLAVQTFGVCTAILKNLVFRMGPEAAEAVGASGLGREAVVFGYQFGYLILPAIAPLILWIGLHRDYLADLIPALHTARSR